MGIGLKDIMSSKDDELVRNEKKLLIKKLVIAATIVFVLLVAALVWLIIDDGKTAMERYEYRRDSLASDMSNISTAALERGIKNSTNAEEYPLIGISLEEEKDPVVLYEGGIEYRHGYYYLTGEEVKELWPTLIIKDEPYIVNYRTGEVINMSGVRVPQDIKKDNVTIAHGGRIYYTLEDIKDLYAERIPDSDTMINIASAKDMEYLHQYPNANFQLSADIDMSEYGSGNGWTPAEKFSGRIEGRGYTINNLDINRPNKENCGLFAEVTAEGFVSNLTIKDANVKGGKYTGIIAGYSSGTIKNCSIISSIVAGSDSATGGLVGGFGKGVIEASYADANVSGRESVGGLVGEMSSGTISSCYANGNVSSTETGIGGLIGTIIPTDYVKVTASYANEIIDGNKRVGGLIGDISLSSRNTVELLDLYSKGEIQEGKDSVGGFVGYVDTKGAGSTIEFKHNYTSTNIVPKEGKTIGGFIGSNYNGSGTSVTSEYCFWKKDPLLDQNFADKGIGETNESVVSFIPKTVAELKTALIYNQWDFKDVWNIDESARKPINDGMPYFFWQQFEEKK